MSSALLGLRVGFFERPHPPGYRGALVDSLVPLLGELGAHVDLVHAEQGLHRLDVLPAWDLVVLKSGSAAALHSAAAAESWGIPSVNRVEPTRLAQDKLASAAILQRAGLPIAPAHLAWLGPSAILEPAGLLQLNEHALVIKSARGSQGRGLWFTDPGELVSLAPQLPDGPYLLMDRVAHTGDDLKVYAAGSWLAGIERPFPAATLDAKLGRPTTVPDTLVATTRAAGRLLGLTCFGCDFIAGPDGWTLVDVNAFPGYKGAVGAAEALAVEIEKVSARVRPRTASRTG